MYTPYKQMTIEDAKDLDKELEALSLIMESRQQDELLVCVDKIRQWLNGAASQQADVNI